jgi:hypothetical protein
MNLHWKRNLFFVVTAAVLFVLCLEAVTEPGAPFADTSTNPLYSLGL